MESIGDYNHDGIVDTADYVVWRKTDGTQAGYNLWRANFGRTAGNGSAAGGAVPEPTALATVCIAALFCLRHCRAVCYLPWAR